MSKRIDLTGQNFGRLTVLEFAYIKNKRTYFKCKCACGNECTKQGKMLKNGRVKSCGCLKKEILSKRMFKHGDTNTRFYNIWAGIKERCRENSEKAKYYYNKNIKIHNRWLEYSNFKEDMYESYLEHVEQFGEKDTTIDRINNDGNYSKENCKWATIREQCNNQDRTNKIIFNGNTMSVSEWAEELGIKPQTLSARINKYKWSIEKALTSKIYKNQYDKQKSSITSNY